MAEAKLIATITVSNAEELNTASELLNKMTNDHGIVVMAQLITDGPWECVDDCGTTPMPRRPKAVGE